jgi:hypothetical protein
MNIQTIMDEADVRVPNVFSSAQKVDWLNEVNFEFFDLVKIPKTETITTDGVNDTFFVPLDAREKNVRKVVAGTSFYRSMNYEDISAAVNYYTIDEYENTITLVPKPRAGKVVMVYNQMGVLPFVSTNLTASPMAPDEYHWLYVLGLCSRVAKAMNDVTIANNYESDYKNGIAAAQQNFLRG